MSKCTFECSCQGNGTCCVKCESLNKCDCICTLIDRELDFEYENIMNNCDWYEEGEGDE